MKQPIFTGSAVALVTPFGPDVAVDYEMLSRLIDLHLQNGTDAIVLCATTGESPTLTSQEYEEVLRRGVRQVNGRIPGISVAGSNSTARGLELRQTAEAAGVDALLAVTPYYNKTSTNRSSFIMFLRGRGLTSSLLRTKFSRSTHCSTA